MYAFDEASMPELFAAVNRALCECSIAVANNDLVSFDQNFIFIRKTLIECRVKIVEACNDNEESENA